MTKHTPGPWKIRPHWHDLYIIANSRVGLVEVCKVGLQSEQEANATLIARAPELLEENARLRKRINDLEQAIANGMNDATRFVDRNGWLESEHQRLKQENERLRALLREYKHRLDKRWREGTRVDSYARGYQDGLEAAEVVFDDVFKAELGSE